MSDTTTTQGTQPTTTTTAQAPAPAQGQPAQAAPSPEVITFTKDELDAARKVWESEAKQAAIRDRFKNQPSPEEIAQIRKERDELKKAHEAKAEAEKTEADKLREARDAALLEAQKAQDEAERRVAEATEKFNAERKSTEILRAVSKLQAEKVIAQGVSAEHVARLTAEDIQVVDGKLIGKDQYQRPCSVEDYLRHWVSQSSQSYFRPPAPAGTGTEPGAAPGTATEPPKTTAEAWGRVYKERGSYHHKRPKGTQNADAGAKPAPTV